MAHTDLILVASLFCWGSFCWLFIMHFGVVSVISKMRKEVFFRYLVLEIYGRALTERIFRINAMFLQIGVARKYVPELMMVNNIILLLTTSWPIVRV